MVINKNGENVTCPKCKSLNVSIDMQTVIWDANSEESNSNCVCNNCGLEFSFDGENPNSVISNFGLSD